MKFAKMQGTGNDFLLVETSDEGRGWGPLAQAMCERHYGVGADGLMLVMPSEEADVRMGLVQGARADAGASGRMRRGRLSRGAPRFAPGEVPVLTEGEPPVLDMPLEVDGQSLAVTC